MASKYNIVLRFLNSTDDLFIHPTFIVHYLGNIRSVIWGTCPQDISKAIRETETYVITVQVNLLPFSVFFFVFG